MRSRRHQVAAFALALILALTAGLLAPMAISLQAQDQDADPAAVVAAAQAARSGDDPEAAADFFTDNAIWVRVVATRPLLAAVALHRSAGHPRAIQG